MKKRWLIGWLIAGIALIAQVALVSGCASTNQKNEHFVVEKRWAISTLEKEHYGFRYLHQMTPMSHKNLVIQGNAVDGLVAVDRDTANQVWRFHVKNGVEPSATLVDGVVFFGGSDGFFHAVDADTGSPNWSFPIRAEGLGKPLVKDGVVYFLAGNNIAYALDATSGKQIWLYNRRDTSSLSVRGGSAPQISGNRVFIGFSDGYLVALNRKNGDVIWEKAINRNKRFRDIDASPVIEGDRIYVSGYDGRLHCLKINNGETLWVVAEGGYSSVTLSPKLLFYSTTSGKVMAIDKSSGKTVWIYKVKHGMATQPVLYKDNLLVFGEFSGALRVLNAFRGAEVGSYHPGRGVSSAPYIDSEKDEAYFISVNANLFALKMGWRTPQESFPWDQKD